jgi:6-phosphogluconolactonase
VITRRFADQAALVRGAAEALAAAIGAAIEARGQCRLALAGGSTPRPVYQRLSLVTSIDWSAVHVFWGDERCVGPDDPSSNYRMACDALLDHVAVPPAQVHRIEAERGGVEAAAAYARVLGAEPLDLVLLGMGDDGHTASLFPGGAEVEERAALAYAARAPVAPHERVTLTLAAINAARAVWFWVVGAGKADRLQEVFTQVASGERVLPAARVAPSSGDLVWFLDEAAAQKV